MKGKKVSDMTSSSVAKTRARTKVKSKPFPIVAIGASAGGLEAVSSFLKTLPSDTGMAYIYIQHLDPSHESMLSDILGRHTKMKVLQAKHLLPVKRDHLFIIPPNKNMAIIDGVLTLNPREDKPSIHMPIDKFFLSLAEKQKDGAIGIVLSGNANDGTLGLKAIKAAGGFTFAQDDTAKFQSMPKSAIAEGVVDYVLSPEKIAKELTRISSNKDFLNKVFDEEPSESIGSEDFNAIINLLRKSTGVDFTHYKINTIQRRILRRLLLLKFDTLKEYLKYLKDNTNEIHALYQDLLINVTSFFRDPDALEYLKKALLPKIIKSKGGNEPIRIWVPACSTGEEAYSLAIILHEIVGDNIANTSIQIFASDLSDSAIAKARIGLYSKSDLNGVSSKRLQKFFTKVDGSYRIVKNIRDICVFAAHNILRDPPFSKLDLISCCNLMIYFDTTLQKKVLHTFHYSLNPNGYLILGKSETISSAPELFSQQEKKYKVFLKKKESANKARFEMNFPVHERAPRLQPITRSQQRQSLSKVNQLEKTVDDMLQKYMPSSVVVNEDFEILQFRGSTSLFLEHAPGKATLNLLKMARPGLSFELRNAIHKSSKSNSQVKQSGIEIKLKGHIHPISIEVSPIKLNADEKLFLIVFEEVAKTIETKSLGTKQQKLVGQLERELEVLKDDMRSLFEDKEAHVEELQSSNEEIVSSNEELQSINEELETSKEEIESANEELTTINNELEIRNDQLSEAQEYAQSIFSTIREAVVVLDSSFRVRNANQAFYDIFKVKEQGTEGVLIYELGNRQWDILQLRQLLEVLIPKNSSFTDFEVEHEFPEIGHKIMLINARAILKRNSNDQLILLAIEDITEHRKAAKLILERESWFRTMANQAPVLIWVVGTDKNKRFFNETWLEFTGSSVSEVTGTGWTNQIHSDDIQRYLKIFHEHFDQRLPFSLEYRLKRADGDFRWIFEIAKPTFNDEGHFSGYIGSCTEIHDKKLLQEELEQRVQQRTYELQHANMELHRSNKELQQFAYVASHDLQEPLRKILTFADRLQHLQNSFPDTATPYLAKIVDSSQRMRKLIDALLNFSKTSLKKLNYEKVDLNIILKTVLTDFELIINEKDAIINFDTLPTIEAIPIQMEQLFHNMISNGLKFSKKDTQPIIDITVKSPSADDLSSYGLNGKMQYCEIIFSDNGIGFEPEYAEQIFEIFHRLNYKQDYPGTGIGLALCRKIISNHKGRIIAKGVENQGASFHIILPFSV